MKRSWYEVSAAPEPFEAVMQSSIAPDPLPVPSRPHLERTCVVTPRTPSSALPFPEPQASPFQAPEASPNHERPQSPKTQHSPNSTSDEEWDPVTTQHLARALQVDPAFVPCETFAYSVICKAKRGQPILKSQIEELWSLIPKALLCRDAHNPGGRYIVFGANPRKHDHVTAPTLNLPHSFRLLCSSIRQTHPSYSFSTVSLRFNMFSRPHRDTRNAPGLSYIHSIIPTSGGDLWIADPDGTRVMVCNDVPVYGRVLDIQTQPQLFNARNTLHATVQWDGPARLVLVAFNTLHAASSPVVISQLAELEVFVKPSGAIANQPTIAQAFRRQHLPPTVLLANSDEESNDPTADE